MDGTIERSIPNIGRRICVIVRNVRIQQLMKQSRILRGYLVGQHHFLIFRKFGNRYGTQSQKEETYNVCKVIFISLIIKKVVYLKIILLLINNY